MKKKKYIIIIILLIFFLVNNFIFTIVIVNGNSMNPTLKDNQILTCDKVNNNYNRFDIIVIKKSGKTYIKRIIGLPNEVVFYKDSNLYINGEIVEENFKHGITEDFTFFTGKNNVIPKKNYIVLGDNKEDSLDSRGFGIVDIDEIICKVIINQK